MDKNPRQPQLKPDILASKALTLTQNVYTASLTEKHTKNFLGIFSWGKGTGQAGHGYQRDVVSKRDVILNQLKWSWRRIILFSSYWLSLLQDSLETQVSLLQQAQVSDFAKSASFFPEAVTELWR